MWARRNALMSVFNLLDAKNPSRLDGTNQRIIAQGWRRGVWTSVIRL
jgi:hypothetical protein